MRSPVPPFVETLHLLLYGLPNELRITTGLKAGNERSMAALREVFEQP